MLDRIELEKFRIMSIVGNLDHERQLSQPLEFTITLYLDLSNAGKSDLVSDTVDYGAVCQLVEMTVKNSSDHLIEKLATRVSDNLLKLPVIKEVTVKLKKLRVPVSSDLGSSAVVIHRKQSQMKSGPNIYTSQAILALGSNLEDRASYLKFAIQQFEQPIVQSQVFETKPVGGPPGQLPYYNMVFAVQTSLDPFALQRKCFEIEEEAGRERKVRWGPRTLDIDILFYDDIRLDSRFLTIPHPRIYERGFVLFPLAEVAPEKLLPGWEDQFDKADIKMMGRLNDLP
jgi:dihydroneopterin aldolase/2-amino-4-hydroxy-6-hydroxymethyldihydropteridine diphosphokinase